MYNVMFLKGIWENGRGFSQIGFFLFVLILFYFFVL